MKFRFHSFSEMKEILDSETLTPEEYAIKREAFIRGQGEDVILGEIDRRIAITRASVIKGLKDPQYSRSGLTQGAAVAFYNSERRIIKDEFYRRAVAYSLAINEVNACGGKIVAFPTAGSSGIVAGAIWAWWDTHNNTIPPMEMPLANTPLFTRLRGAFLISSLVGVIIAQRATIAGSEGGCQAECGSAGAMAACALSYLENLSLDECFSAAALSLKNCLGLVCDPVAGLVEVPCVKRNAFVAVNALTAVDMTLAGIKSAIPFDDVVLAMKQIGETMPTNLRENAQGGLAATPSGLAVRDAMGTNTGPMASM
jgi:L-serine dehydratase